jgi:hypothetical protein
MDKRVNQASNEEEVSRALLFDPEDGCSTFLL